MYHSRNQRHAGRNLVDLIGLTGFHDQGFIIGPPRQAHDAQLQQIAGSLPKRIGGMATNLTDGLRKAVSLLCQTPRGRHRRIWLLSDGHPNREKHGLSSVIQQARKAYINVNTIGFGDDYDGTLLRKISDMTHNGRFVPIKTLRQLTRLLVTTATPKTQRQRRRRAETTVLAIDLSPSMNCPMDGRRRIDVVKEAVLQLLHYKQQCFA